MNKHTYSLVVSAMLGAVAFVLMFLETPIPSLIPSFVKLDVSDVPELLGAYALGPVYGVLIALIKNVLHILIKGTSTAYVGELANFTMGATLALVAGLFYKFKNSRGGAVAGAIVGSVAMGLVSIPINMFITYPLYAQFFGGMEAIIKQYQLILEWADELWKCLVVFNAPFTLVKGLICAVICAIIYKPLAPLLHSKQK